MRLNKNGVKIVVDLQDGVRILLNTFFIPFLV